jgi:RNA polymerase sigma-70 factor, ECF subfamily
VERDFDEFFRASYPVARSVALRIVGSIPEAEDVAADAFAKALRRWSTVGSLPYREAWVLRVTTNGAIDVVRRSQRRRSLPVAENSSPETETRLALVSALAQLPRRQQEAVVLRHFADLTPLEVAASLGISVNTVKRHLQRGLAALRMQLDQEDL